MAVTSDADLLTIFKIWYSDEKLQNLLFRNSPVLKAIDKKRIGGKQYNYAAMYGAGGNITASYTKAVANAASNSKNAEFQVTPGKLFTAYNVTQQEILASQGNKAAYESAQVAKFFAGNENVRKGLAASLYSFGYGDVGKIDGALVATDTSFVAADYSVIMKLDVGTKFQFGILADDITTAPLADIFTITGINGLTVTFTPAIGTGDAVADGAYVFYEGGRDGSGNPLFPIGLAQWIPSVADRTTSAWTTYIGTSFYGVNRSANPDRLAGAFYKQASGGETKSQALTKGLQLVRRQGGVPDMIIINDEDWSAIAVEINDASTLVQQINTSDKKGKNAFTQGISDMQFAFSTSYLDKIYDDPYCPKGTAYILDMSVISFISLSNAKPMDDGVAGNNPGSPDVDVDGQASTNYELMLQDYLDIRPASDTDDGPGQRVSISVYGNFVIHNTAHCAVVKFV